MEEDKCAFCDTPGHGLSFSNEDEEHELSFCDVECLRSYVRQQKLMRYLP